MEVVGLMNMKFEETELRLGLPGNGGNVVVAKKKRGFSDETTTSDDDVDLKLNLSSKDNSDAGDITTAKGKAKTMLAGAADPAKPPAKAQVVGWPPVRASRKNVFSGGAGQNKNNSEEGEKGIFVKVSMDGAPYLRKVDLKMYKSYKDLSHALTHMFGSFTTANCEDDQGMKDFMNESKLIMDLLNGSADYVQAYEDKDGDWMLVGDVPWEMFVESCKRLRIMKGTEAIGRLAPRSVEKCKNKS